MKKQCFIFILIFSLLVVSCSQNKEDPRALLKPENSIEHSVTEEVVELHPLDVIQPDLAKHYTLSKTEKGLKINFSFELAKPFMQLKEKNNLVKEYPIRITVKDDWGENQPHLIEPILTKIIYQAEQERFNLEHEMIAPLIRDSYQGEHVIFMVDFLDSNLLEKHGIIFHTIIE